MKSVLGLGHSVTRKVKSGGGGIAHGHWTDHVGNDELPGIVYHFPLSTSTLR